MNPDFNRVGANLAASSSVNPWCHAIGVLFTKLDLAAGRQPKYDCSQREAVVG